MRAGNGIVDYRGSGIVNAIEQQAFIPFRTIESHLHVSDGHLGERHE
jgi:hypothetical protein